MTRETSPQPVRRALLPSGEVADDASPRLADLRRTLLRLKAQLTSVMEGYLRSRDAERLLQDRIITTRNDRYVLLLKADQKGQLPGIVHGSSGSGASFFLEPLPAVELNNDIVSLQDEERAEVLRILEQLTSRVRERADDIAHLSSVMGELDAVQAMALLAGEMDAHPPEIVEERQGIELLDSRHPLLMPRVAERLGISRTEGARAGEPARRRRGAGARDQRPEHRGQDGRAQDRRALRPDGAVRAARAGRGRAAGCRSSGGSMPTSATSSRSPRTCPPSPRTSPRSSR